MNLRLPIPVPSPRSPGAEDGEPRRESPARHPVPSPRLRGEGQGEGRRGAVASSRRALSRLPLGLAFASLLLVAVSASAQDFPGIARGFEPEKAYQIGEIESTNLFNGGLTLTIQIGGTYPIGPSFGLGLTLVYNSHLWRYQEIPNVTTQVLPLEGFNAGFGWTLSLGRFLHPDDPANDSDGFVYYDASGARHDFYSKLHPSDTSSQSGYLYSRDGSYLRAVLTGSVATPSAVTVQLPDGSEQVFERIGTTSPPKYRLLSMKDAFNNAFTVGYDTFTDPQEGLTDRWTISSPATFNTMEVLFNVTPAVAGDYAAKGGVVRKVNLKATGGREALYTFSYALKTIAPGCESQVSPQASVPFLTQILLPEGAKWEMPGGVAAYNTTGGGTCNNQLGLLQKLTLPTQGRFEWSWGSFLFPQPAEQCRAAFYNQVGLSARRHYDRNGVLQATWSYAQALDHVSGCGPITPDPPRHSKVTVTSPLGDVTEHFFVVDTNPVRTREELYGYPRRGWADTDGLGADLSTKVYDGVANLMRTTYARYEWDGGAGGTTEQPPRANQRLAFTNTVHHDDGNRFANQTFGAFDGFGHYRKATLNGGFGSGDVRETVVTYNPTYPSFPHDSTAPTTPWPTTSKWVLGTYPDKKVCEGALFDASGGCPASGQLVKEQFCFNPNTGFLARHRVLVGSSPQGNDLLALFTHSGGFVTREQYYGGDGAGLATTADVCAVAIPVNDTYRLDHTYQSRVRATSKYFGTSFFTLDETIDASTGLPVVSRDSSGIATNLEYDRQGRLTWAKPAVGHGAWTEVTYNNATSTPSVKASVVIERHDNGSESAAVLAGSSVVFDDLGRVYREFVDLANGTVGRRQTTYNAMGWKQYVSEQATPNEGNFNTQYANYDPFGRPRSITPPDGSGHAVQLAYAGDRVVTRTVKIGTSRDGAGAIVEQSVATTEIYDRQGRLAQVQELSGTGGTATTTAYKYDVGGRLKVPPRLPPSCSSGRSG